MIAHEGCWARIDDATAYAGIRKRALGAAGKRGRGKWLAALLCYENTHSSARRERRKPVPAVGEAN
jgi:hypothetical protein